MNASKTSWGAWIVLGLLLGCKKAPEVTIAPTASASTTGAPSAATATPKATAKKKNVRAAEAMLAPEKSAEYKKRMSEARKAAGAKKWSAAVSSFEAALAANPDDPRALSELGYAAYFAGDLAKAKATNARALAVATDPTMRAQILFNEGVVLEKESDRDGARRKFEASLALRSHATVRAHLDALGGGKNSACDAPATFASIDALCTCLKDKERQNIFSVPDAASFVCEEKKVQTADITALRWGAGGDAIDVGEHPWVLLAKVTDGWQKIANLGSDYTPGMNGINNETEVARTATREIDGHKVVEVFWGQRNSDTNMAGLQLEQYTTAQVTVCVLGAKPSCPVTVSVEETSELSYPLEPSSEEEKAELAELKKEAPERKTKQTATYSIDGKGRLTVKETAGKRDYLAPMIAGINLW